MFIPYARLSKRLPDSDQLLEGRLCTMAAFTSAAAVSSALTLLSNILMAWNPTDMQRALENIEASGG